MLHAEPFETHLLSAELCILFIYFLKGNCIGLEYHIILSKIHIIVIIKTKIIDQNKSCSNKRVESHFYRYRKWRLCWGIPKRVNPSLVFFLVLLLAMFICLFISFIV